MPCLLCDHDKTHKHGKTGKGSQRYFCPVCKHSFTDTFDTIYYCRQLQPDEVHTILQSHCPGSSLRGVARSSRRAYGTVVHLVRPASQKAQLVHNAFVQRLETSAITGDELWSFLPKKTKTLPAWRRGKTSNRAETYAKSKFARKRVSQSPRNSSNPDYSVKLFSR